MAHYEGKLLKGRLTRLKKIAAKLENIVPANLMEQTRRVEVDPFVDDAVAVEEKYGDRGDSEGPAGWRLPEKFAAIRSEEVEFRNDRVVCGYVNSYVLVPLVGKGDSLTAVVGENFFVAVMNLARGHDLIVRVAVEGAKAGRPIVVDLRLKVPFDHGESLCGQVGRCYSPGPQSMLIDLGDRFLVQRDRLTRDP